MMRYLLAGLLILLVSGCTPTKQHTRVKREQCRRDKTLYCSKRGAPVLEQMSEKEIAASITQFGAAFKNNSKMVFKDTRFSEIDQCISMFQYYNCKTYCESDTMTKNEKLLADQKIVKECKGMVPANAADQKNRLLGKVEKREKRRIWIRLMAKNFKLNPDLKKLIYLAFEEKATNAKYQIIDDAMKRKAYLEIKRQHGYAQNDPRFLPAYRKQLAPNVMVEIEINPLGRMHLFSIRFTELETAATLMTKNLKYNERKDPEKEIIFDDFQNLAAALFKNLEPGYLNPPNTKPLLSRTMPKDGVLKIEGQTVSAKKEVADPVPFNNTAPPKENTTVAKATNAVTKEKKEIKKEEPVPIPGGGMGERNKSKNSDDDDDNPPDDW